MPVALHKVVGVPHAFERAAQHLVFKGMGPVQGHDLDGHALPDAKVYRLPGDLVPEFAAAVVAAGDDTLPGRGG